MKLAPYDNGKIKIGLLYTQKPPPLDFDMEAIQKVLCPPSKRVIPTDFDDVMRIIEEGLIIICAIGLLAFLLYPSNLRDFVCN